MVICATQEAKKSDIPILRIHSSSAAALQQALESHAGQ
jgi:hypothetical protein